jgi:fructose-1,6-bisphosphatase/sedoheptulose 1,7-bisphosphatase-like protein
MPIVRVKGAELYHEIRGSGPSVLFIMGAAGDAVISARLIKAGGGSLGLRVCARARGNGRRWNGRAPSCTAQRMGSRNYDLAANRAHGT